MKEARRLSRPVRHRLLYVNLITFILCHLAEAGLVAYWAADGNANDSVGPNSGAAVGTVNYSDGMIEQAFDLATTGYINISNPVTGGLESATGFTVTAWILRKGVGSIWGTASLANLRTTANKSGFSIEEVYSQPNSLGFLVNTTGSTTSYAANGVSAAGWDFGVFHHLAATFDAATHTMVLYRDGEVVASRNDLPNTVMIANSASAFQMGRNIVNDSRWNGLIDEVRFYNTALSQSEIRQVMNSIVMQAPEIRPDSSVVIHWTSLTNRLYTLHHSTNLLSGFSVLEGNIPGTPPLNTHTDTVTGLRIKFWKVTMEE